MSDSNRSGILLLVPRNRFRTRILKSIESIEPPVDLADSVEDATKLLRSRPYSLLIADSSFASALQQRRPERPELPGGLPLEIFISDAGDDRLVIDSLHPTPLSNFKQPFSSDGFRYIVRWLLTRPSSEPGIARDYESLIEQARRTVSKRKFDEARQFCQDALQLDSTHADVHNLMGILHELSGNRLEAQEEYRMALELDPTYAPARANLHESVEPGTQVSFYLDEAKRVSLD